MKLKGKSVYAGIAIGPIVVICKEELQVKRERIQSTGNEIERLGKAIEKAKEELEGLYQIALKEVGEENAMIFQIHQLMLEDADFIDTAIHAIKTEMINAEYALARACDLMCHMFESMEDEYMKGRAADVRDISNRVIRILQQSAQQVSLGKEPAIIFAEDLSPSETIQLDKTKILAFVTRFGTTTSHTAILARTMNIPAVIGVDFSKEELVGKIAIVDGITGSIYIDPNQELLEEYKKKQIEEIQKKNLLKELKEKESITLDGKKINLYANIGSITDVAAVLDNGGSGIGLFRSEFLYLGRNNYPSEEEQFQAYKMVVEAMAGKRVIIRTLDIGADKQADYFSLEKEENPALGYRAVRICLDRVELFKTQLRAILRASYYGLISIMFPMIISEEEVREIKKIVIECKEELKEQEIAIGEVELGIMIETPAAVMISDLLAKEVDFFSIGTNDLTQYTLAVDRQNPNLTKQYNPHHIAILRMIQIVINNGHDNGCWVGICGELAADLELTEKFVQMGIDELSVSPSCLLPLKEKVRKIRFNNLLEKEHG